MKRDSVPTFCETVHAACISLVRRGGCSAQEPQRQRTNARIAARGRHIGLIGPHGHREEKKKKRKWDERDISSTSNSL